MSNYYLFMDESGDHSLSNINADFPIFVLCALLFKEKSYQRVCDKFNNIKMKYFNTLDVIFHSRDIRKCNGAFKILFNLDIKKRFYKDVDRLLATADYKIVASAINKKKHIKQYGKLARDPYEIALTFVLERILFETDNYSSPHNINVIIENRGRKEDAQISARYNELLYRGSGRVESRRFLQVFNTDLMVKKKRDNDCGIQLADLCAYPIARYVLKPTEPNPAFNVIMDKIRKGPRGRIGYGIKIFP